MEVESGHTHTHTHTRARARTHTHTQARARAHSHRRPNPSTTHTHTSKDSDRNKMVIFSTPKSPRVACSSRECVYVLDLCNPYALWAGPRFACFLICCFPQIPKSKIAVLRFSFPLFPNLCLLLIDRKNHKVRALSIIRFFH